MNRLPCAAEIELYRHMARENAAQRRTDAIADKCDELVGDPKALDHYFSEADTQTLIDKLAFVFAATDNESRLERLADLRDMVSGSDVMRALAEQKVAEEYAYVH